MISEKNRRGCKFIWKKNQIDSEQTKQLALQTNFTLPIAEVLVSRGLDSKEKVFDFIFPAINLSKNDAKLMKDAQKAIGRILEAIEKQEKILIFGDYDVDGMTSTSIAVLALRHIGAKVNYYLPDRIRDGYGLTSKIVDKAAKSGYHLLITVDNGTTSIEAAALAKQLGLDLIITDHHQPKGELPDVLALVNPHQKDCCYPYKYFCGAGVIFKLMSFIYQKLEKSLPDKVYELLAMGTVADIVPLTGENRHWVRYGLDLLNKESQSFAFRCLAANINKLEKRNWTSTDLGFGIAPQLNALGRLEDPIGAVKFLIGSNEQEVLTIGSSLKIINQRRREVEALIYAEVEQNLKSGSINLLQESVILVGSKDWPPGVVGLVSSKLTGNYGRPSFVFHIDKNGLAKGSCRSIPEFNLFEALSKNADILKTFGGHAQAAGLSLEMEKLPLLKQRLEAQVREKLSFEELQPSLEIDANLQLQDLNNRLLTDLQRLEPFGNSNKTPVFEIESVVLTKQPELLKEKHLKILVFASGQVKPVIFFNRPELYPLLIAQEDKPFNLAAQVLVNDFNGHCKIELLGMDVFI